jgi:hypothetical protein
LHHEVRRITSTVSVSTCGPFQVPGLMVSAVPTLAFGADTTGRARQRGAAVNTTAEAPEAEVRVPSTLAALTSTFGV